MAARMFCSWSRRLCVFHSALIAFARDARPYLTVVHRRTTSGELARLQGLTASNYDLTNISRHQFGQMIGNAMSKPVILEIWRSIWRAQGLTT